MKAKNFPMFKRMHTVKAIVYRQHTTMLRMYEQYCREASLSAYWSDDDEGDAGVEEAEATNEVVDDEQF